MSDIIIKPIERIKKKCLCCGNEIELFPYEDKDFCDRCLNVVFREFFNKENGNLTIEQLRNKIRSIIHEEEN